MSRLSFALESRFPKLLADGYKVESRKDRNYNCIAWSAKRDQTHWWEPRKEPGVYWPEGIANDYSMESFIGCFAHVSHQLPDGRWASKLGDAEDIEHNSLKALESDDYGSPSVFLKRAKTTTNA